MPRITTAIIAAAVTAVVAACGGSSDASTSPPQEVIDTVVNGSYALSTVNGKTLPATVASDTNYLVEVMSATLALRTDGKYTSTVSWRETVATNVSTHVDPDSGTWIKSAPGRVSFTSVFDGPRSPATFDNGKITIADSSVFITTFVFAKRQP